MRPASSSKKSVAESFLAETYGSAIYNACICKAKSWIARKAAAPRTYIDIHDCHAVCSSVHSSGVKQLASGEIAHCHSAHCTTYACLAWHYGILPAGHHHRPYRQHITALNASATCLTRLALLTAMIGVQLGLTAGAAVDQPLLPAVSRLLY